MNTAKDLVLSLYQNLGNEAHAGLQSKTFSDKLYQFIENDNVLTSTSPVVLAATFFQTAGKTTLLHQSEQLDDQLRNTMKTYRVVRQSTVTNVLKNLIELCQYLPIDYIQSSFSTILKYHLNELYNNFTREKCQEFLNYIDIYLLIDEKFLSCFELITRVLSIE
ncbi:unnamed protein product [Rotaria sordida]|uniref:Uncharacterized protein n=1 Tax=Rotaria sordida TaxID=392033 RepID=A0A815DQ27_9BILA|nr:unnamed protein product [Rotaria sordida]CAF1269449.1 unnamed protein product [Rotaria sordida]CAF1304533.1 unnamed protein product [Rotaria sordida]CAF1542509.1 unnamed protein product [Rotaria sordida]